MKISPEEVERIARLAHLRFGPDELDRFRGHLEQILDYVEQLRDLPTEGVEPAAGGLIGPVLPLRDDTPRPGLPNDEALSNAPESGQGHFKVPKVIG